LEAGFVTEEDGDGLNELKRRTSEGRRKAKGFLAALCFYVAADVSGGAVLQRLAARLALDALEAR
jgi:hypothetical protein